jgi:hypothetical protein
MSDIIAIPNVEANYTTRSLQEEFEDTKGVIKGE